MKLHEKSFEISIAIDDKCALNGYLTNFGFSALINNHVTQNLILFDTGSNGNILIHNLSKFNVQIKDIKKVIISHDHFDHTGGLSVILKHNPDIDVFIPHDDLMRLKRVFPEARIHGVDESTMIEENIFSSGQLGSRFTEQCLYLKTLDGDILLIVGCTHPGLENFIIKARDIGKIKAIIGGFHGFNKFAYLEGIDFIGACHCTAHARSIQKRFPDQFKKICVGSSFSF
jgi:7,8-dihydropterin-6-yl-methyl-4-(beta-D-ribofuranosyl)aminobenzene 5'-phosphate synthase